MKRSLLTPFVFLIFLTVLFTVASCGKKDGVGNSTGSEKSGECTHEYSSKTLKEPSYSEEGVIEYTCVKCGKKYTEQIEKLIKKSVSDDQLMRDFYNCTYNYSVFRITTKELLNYGVSGAELEKGTGEEAISLGYIKKSDIDSSIDIDNLYVINVRGNVKVNPELPYYTTYEKQAMTALLLYDDNGDLINWELLVCKNLSTYALLIMTR